MRSSVHQNIILRTTPYGFRQAYPITSVEADTELKAGRARVYSDMPGARVYIEQTPDPKSQAPEDLDRAIDEEPEITREQTYATRMMEADKPAPKAPLRRRRTSAKPKPTVTDNG